MEVEKYTLKTGLKYATLNLLATWIGAPIFMLLFCIVTLVGLFYALFVHLPITLILESVRVIANARGAYHFEGKIHDIPSRYAAPLARRVSRWQKKIDKPAYTIFNKLSELFH